MNIRFYQKSDALPLAELFFNTIRTVNRQHYSDEQVKAWVEQTAKEQKIERLFVEASITAKPFFEKMGFTLVKRTNRGKK